MKFISALMTLVFLLVSASSHAADRIYSCEILSGKHTGYNINVISSSSGELKINLLASMNTLVTYTVTSSNLCPDQGYCVQAESKKKIEGKSMLMSLSISKNQIQKNNKIGLMARASFDSFDLRNEPASVRVHDEDVSLICTK